MIGSVVLDSAWDFFGSVRGSVSAATMFCLAVWLGQCCMCSGLLCLSMCVVTTGR